MSTKMKPPLFRGDIIGRTITGDIDVGFWGSGVGIDRIGYRQIVDLLEEEPAVIAVQPLVVGREGEQHLFVRLADDRDIKRVFDMLTAVVPDRSAGRPISIRTETGLVFSNE